MPGDWLRVLGEKKLDKETGLLKLKAERVVPATTPTQTALPVKAALVQKQDQYFGLSKSIAWKRGMKPLSGLQKRL